MYSTLNGQRKTKNEKRIAAREFAGPVFVLLFSFFVLPGCQGIDREQPPAPVNDTPLVVDEAMQIRDWDRSTNYYANGATVAGGTGYVWEVADWVNPGHRRFIDAPWPVSCAHCAVRMATVSGFGFSPVMCSSASPISALACDAVTGVFTAATLPVRSAPSMRATLRVGPSVVLSACRSI